MKLLYCPNCRAVFNLWSDWKSCTCGASRGRYLEDRLHAEIEGSGIPLGFNNFSFHLALDAQPQEGLGARFEAFVIPKVCPTVKNLTNDTNVSPKPRGRQKKGLGPGTQTPSS